MLCGDDLLADLDTMKTMGIRRLAAVLADDAEPLRSVARTPRIAVVFGSEAQGLDPITLGHCDRRLTIPMKLGTNSLNVAVAAAVFLFHLNGPG
jgi:tRNA G18 (ribose-2'-O)-methylase SpoU